MGNLGGYEEEMRTGSEDVHVRDRAKHIVLLAVF